jgi:hypothetical protein
MTISGIAYSQQYYRIRTGAFDSLAYLAQKGKICDTALNSHLKAITALQNLNRASERLSQENAAQVATLKAQIGNLKDQNQNQQDLYTIEKSKLKQQKRKWIKIAISEAGLIALLVAVILL